MDITLKYLLFVLIALICAAMIHSITRMIMGKQANIYPGGTLVLVFYMSPWWVAALGGLAGHLLSVVAWNNITTWTRRARPVRIPNPEDV